MRIEYEATATAREYDENGELIGVFVGESGRHFTLGHALDRARVELRKECPKTGNQLRRSGMTDYDKRRCIQQSLDSAERCLHGALGDLDGGEKVSRENANDAAVNINEAIGFIRAIQERVQ